MPEEGVCTSLCGVRVRHVYIVSDGPASSLQPWAFLPGHQKEFELETLRGKGLWIVWKRPSVYHRTEVEVKTHNYSQRSCAVCIQNI